MSSDVPGVPDVIELDGAARVEGEVRTPGDKSVSHRAVLLAALGEGRSEVHGVSDGEDVARTIGCVAALGAEVAPVGEGALAIDGGRERVRPDGVRLECGNSGTTIRLCCGVVAGLGGRAHLDGDASLRTRPMDRVAEPLGRMGATVTGQGPSCAPPLEVTAGALRAITYRLPVASAQVKSAVLLAGLGADGPTTVVEPVATRTHTERMLAKVASRVDVVERADGRHTTVWPSALLPAVWRVPGDPSQAAFFLVAALLAERGEVAVRGVECSAERTGFVDVLAEMGGHVLRHVVRGETGDLIATSSSLTSTTVAAARVPSMDEVPVLAVAAAAATGTTTFLDAGELRVKESDRLDATVRLVRALGATAEVHDDALAVEGLGSARAFARFEYDAAGDHRMAMAAAVAATVGQGGVVAGFAGVATSYPRFLVDLASLR